MQRLKLTQKKIIFFCNKKAKNLHCIVEAKKIVPPSRKIPGYATDYTYIFIMSIIPYYKFFKCSQRFGDY